VDLHQNDGGLFVTHPQVLGDGTAGTVVEVGPGVKRLKVGDKVFGFTWRTQKEKSHQEFVTAPEFLLGLVRDALRVRCRNELTNLPGSIKFYPAGSSHAWQQFRDCLSRCDSRSRSASPLAGSC
jgi:NADPH:quinone reductase-like Zn-dependent oxidoreductase